MELFRTRCFAMYDVHYIKNCFLVIRTSNEAGSSASRSVTRITFRNTIGIGNVF